MERFRRASTRLLGPRAQILDYPSILTSSTLWADATKLGNLYQDFSATPVTTGGQNVQVVQDALGRSLALAHNGTVPVVDLTIANGNPALQFTASTTRFLAARPTSAPGVPTGSALALSSFFTVGAKTLIMALRFASHDGNQRGIFQDNTGGYFFVRSQTSAGNAALIPTNYDGTNDATASRIFTANTWGILTVRHGSGTLGQRRNGEGTWVTVASGNTSTLANQLRLGSGFTANCMVGYVAQVATFDTALSDSDCLLIEKHFGASVGLSI